MINQYEGVAEALDDDLVGFITAVDPVGQPQTSPVWFVRDDEDLIVYNRDDALRLRSIAGNRRVAFNLRADQRAASGLSLEATAELEDTLPPAKDFPGYLDKYASEIDRLGWTPESFSKDYPAGIRLSVTRVREWGL